MFPEEWHRFRDHLLPADTDGDLAAGYSRLLHSPDPGVREAAAAAWCRWEDTHVSLADKLEPTVAPGTGRRRGD